MKAARTSSRRGEWLAAVLLMAKGYGVIGVTLKTPQGEDRHPGQACGVLAVVEVKRRTSLLAALEAVGHDQRERLRRAGANLAARRPQLTGAAVRLDLVALAPGRFPVHIPDAWKGT
ncbi:MAG: YraN family protein [Alphaproteobacteria bacterium]|nr:YraN family protein [Alphaproteobacteria bacterium]